MNDPKQTLAFARWIAIIAVAAGACQGGAPPLEPVEEGLYLSECFGADTICEPTIATETLAVPEARACDGETRTGMKGFALRDIMTDVCATRGNETYCSARGQGAAAVSAIGTIWLFHNTFQQRWTRDASSIRRYGADGALLGLTELSDGAPFTPDEIVGADLALDDRGSGFGVVYEAYGPAEGASSRAWFYELDAAAQPVREPAVLELASPDIELAGDGHVLISGVAPEEPSHGTLAKLDARGVRVWSQTDVRMGEGAGRVADMASTGSGHAMVVALRNAPELGVASRYGLMHFDEDGNVVWDRVLDLDFWDFGGWPTLTADGKGGAIMAVVRGASLNGVFRRTWIGRIDADGAVAWAYEVLAEGGPVVIHPETGEVYVRVLGVSETDASHLAVISADGERCTLYAPPAEGRFFLEKGLHGIDADGRIFVSGANDSLNRIQLPE